MRIKNTSKNTQGIPGFPAFAPGETRDFSQNDAKTLLDNPFLIAIESTETFESENLKSEKPKGGKRKS